MKFIQDYKIDNIQPWERNPRKNDEAVKKLVPLLKEHGFINPVIIDQEGILRAGHTRVKAAIELGMATVPALIVNFKDVEHAIAYAIADNKSNEWAEWDFKELKELISELDNFDFDLEMTGFDLDEMGDILTYEPEQKEIIEDEVPEEPEEPISKRGDIWLLGKHRLMCGDSTSDDVDILMDGKKADMIFTDPPYGVNYEGGVIHGNKINTNHKRNKLKNDDNTIIYSNFINNIDKWITEGALYIFYATRYTYETFKPLKEKGINIMSVLAWIKINTGYADINSHYKNRYEPCVYCKIGNKTNFIGAKNENTTWEIEKDRNNKMHPTQKPISVPYRAIKNHNAKIVGDAFGGSGSTLIAAEQLNRICYMMELDEIYVDVIVQRYINFKENTDNIYLIRNGKQYSYEEVQSWQKENTKNG